jgi:hypothetical protein
MKEEIFLLRKEEIIPLMKQALTEQAKAVRHPIEWVTPKQAREFLNIKSPVTLQRIMEESDVRVRYRNTRPEYNLADLVTYKENN